MTKVVDYQVIDVHKVAKAFTEGWVLYGHPYYDNVRGPSQAMVKYEEKTRAPTLPRPPTVEWVQRGGL